MNYKYKMETMTLICLNKVWDEFIKMKHNYDIVKNAQFSLSKIAQENSSLDNLIQASFNPIFTARPRVDSLQNIRDEKFGRKRAMTIDGPVRDKYVPLKTSNKSAFSSYKHEIKTTEAQRQSKDTEEELKDNDLKIELKLSKKRTYAEMKKNFHMQSSQLLIFPHESFSGRKRAKSF